MSLIVTCPSCHGRFGAFLTHMHTSLAVFNERFAECQKCHGRGAVTCDTCQGFGRVEKGENGEWVPADVTPEQHGRNQFMMIKRLGSGPMALERPKKG